MPLNESKILHNLHKFSRQMRFANDMFLMWKVCEYFKPDSVLEIGFYEGQTLGLLLEACDLTCQITSVDISFSRKQLFDQLFIDTNINFLQTDSKNLILNKQFDFVHIDGDHSYDYVLNDVLKVLPLLHKNSILCMDDYKSKGVGKVINEQLLGQNDMIPFLVGDQEMFFHHSSHSADHFLDQWVQEKSKNFFTFSNCKYEGFVVLSSKLPNLFVDNNSVFLEALKFYNL